MSMQIRESTCYVLLTGATGFLGKVVLEELLLRRNEYDLDKILLLIRPKGRQTAKSRFERKITSSPCFSQLPKDWTDSIQIIEGDLDEQECGIVPATYEKISSETTHIIHCAGSSSTELEIDEAIKQNITSTLNIYKLARDCPKLTRLTFISTAYVTPHTFNTIYATPSPLPKTAVQIHEEIQSGKLSTKSALRLTSQANTTTLTKCLAEHLLSELRGNMPITIIRPSLISASFQHPFPGWIEPSLFETLISSIGAGILHVLNCNPDVLLDIIPVDYVARTIINETLLAPPSPHLQIVHSVATLANSLHLSTISDIITEYFTLESGFNGLGLRYMGPKNLEFYARDLVEHGIPLFVAKCWFWIKRDKIMRRDIKRVEKDIRTVNCGMAYFLTRTFDFRGPEGGLEEEEEESDEELLDRLEYPWIVCEGIDRFLLAEDIGLGKYENE